MWVEEVLYVSETGFLINKMKTLASSSQRYEEKN